MGGPGAPDDIDPAPQTQVWLATSADQDATVTGRYFYHQRWREHHPAAADIPTQDALLNACEPLTDVTLPSLPPRLSISRSSSDSVKVGVVALL